MGSFDYFEDVSLLEGKDETEALNLLKRPTLFKVNGQDNSRAVLVSTLIHGSEPCGFRAFLEEINRGRSYPFDVYFLVGNVAAAKIAPQFSHRNIPDGRNFNRIWCVDAPEGEEELCIAELEKFICSLPLIGVLDLHSFMAKGVSPHSFVVSIDDETLGYAKKFTPYVLKIEAGMGALIEATSKLCPSFVVECGTHNTPEADAFAGEVLDKFFKEFGVLDGSAGEPLTQYVYVNMTNFKVAPSKRVVWAEEEDTSADATLRPDCESLNLSKVEAGEFWGWASSLDFLKAWKGKTAVDVADYFYIEDGKLYLKHSCVPNLMSANEFIAKESGFYLFEKKEA
ncbi:hypothetical protein [Sneathiella glossodoripedis]|uniref:hypothetical protein n=1 Tax=Sneathiella glossodoripedis TaxID=418853 RepID=UPI00046F8A88|nr:hypothetical protein [Sneathiella glossodoripedis]